MLQVYTYDKAPITFVKADNTVYVNGTEAAFAFGRSAKLWLDRGATKEFIIDLEKKNSSIINTVFEKTSYENKGIWLHKDAAAFLAQWISPLFAIWLNERVNNLVNLSAEKEQIITLTKRVEVLENKVKSLTKAPAKKKPAKAKIQAK